MNQDYYKELVNEAKLKPSDSDLAANKRQSIECLLCGNIFEAAVKGKMTNFRKHGYSGCKECTSTARYEDARKKRYNEMTEKFDFLSDVDFSKLNNMVYVDVKNKHCGHQFNVKYGNLLNRDVNCPVCNTERKKQQYIDFNEKRHKESLSLKKGFEKYKQLVYKLTRENYRKYKSRINPQKFPRVLSGGDGYHLDHIVSVRNSFDLGVPAKVCADPSNLRMVKWKDNNQKWKRSSLDLPDAYLPYIDNDSDGFIDEVRDGSHWETYKSFGKFMLTLYSGKNSFGIYYANLSMNSQQILGSKKYLLEMKQYFDERGITVIIVFEDEWLTNKSLVKEKIRHYMGQSEVKRVYARKCRVEEITTQEKNSFLNSCHIQGTCVSQINLGLYHDSELVAVMTFSKPRVLMSQSKSFKQDLVYELTRFATASGVHVVGGASKLLKHFQRTYEWENIFSYADRRWSSGNLYEALGFDNTKVNPTNYYYVIDGKRKHRWGFRKDAIREKFPSKYDNTLTEYQNMLKLGYDRVWDCGTLKYEMRKTDG